jgi:hypothetical protein
VVRTERQRELIRNRLNEYRDLQSVGLPRKVSWQKVGDEIFHRTLVRVRAEVVRQWVKQFVQQRRSTPLSPNAEELEAIIAFLIKIGMLLPEELENPKPPYLLLHSFLELLRIDPDKPIPPPPRELDGVYEAWHHVDDPEQIEEKWIKTNLTLELDRTRYVRATETWEIHYRGAGEPPAPGGSRPSEGWGIVTPEGLFLVMKTQPYRHNYYYLPVEQNSRYLPLLRHQPMISRDYAPKTRPFEELNDAMRGRTLLLEFNKVPKLSAGKGE